MKLNFHKAILLFSVIQILLLFSTSTFGQLEEWNKTFKEGYYIGKDNSIHKGLLKIFPVQRAKLKFKSSKESKTSKIISHEIAGFIIDSTKFISLYNVKVYCSLGMKKKNY